MANLKKCPYCSREIEAEAVACPLCKEPILPSLREKKNRWYFKTSVLVIALLSVGPLALPLLWFNPRYGRNTKILWTVVTAVLTYWLTVATQSAVSSLKQYYESAFQQL